MDPFSNFVGQRSRDLQRIARATRGEHAYEDVVNQAWLMMETLKVKRKGDFEIADPEHQELLLKFLYQDLVRYTEKNVIHAVRLDHATSADADDGQPNRLMNRLASNEGRSPLEHLLNMQESDCRLRDIEDHASLAGGWLKLIRSHGGSNAIGRQKITYFSFICLSVLCKSALDRINSKPFTV